MLVATQAGTGLVTQDTSLLVANSRLTGNFASLLLSVPQPGTRGKQKPILGIGGGKSKLERSHFEPSGLALSPLLSPVSYFTVLILPLSPVNQLRLIEPSCIPRLCSCKQSSPSCEASSPVSKACPSWDGGIMLFLHFHFLPFCKKKKKCYTFFPT